MVRLIKYLAALVALLSMLVMTSSLSIAATIAASVDRITVQENESVNLKFSSDAGVDDDPDFSPLEKDFRILNRNQSSNISIINGRVSRQITWQLMLMPKRSGNLTIPSIAFGNDQSNALSIKVVPATTGSSGIADDLVYVEASVDNDTIYVQSQLVYTLRIYHAVQLRNASLSELELNDSDAIVEKLSENKTYEKIIDGRRYRVFEKQFAIFPQNVGELKIEPAILEAQYIDLPRVLRTKRVESDPVKITVQAIPKQAGNVATGYWLPARSLTLSEEWSEAVGEINVGEPVTRTLTLTASGLLSAQLPELSNIASKKGIKQYADQPVLDNVIKDDGFVGKRQEKIAYIPTEPGELKLPAIKITWWNTETNKLEMAKLPGRVIKVISIAAQEQQPLNLTEKGGGVVGEREDAGRLSLPQDANDKIAGMSSQLWFGVSVALLILWLLTLTSWFIASRNRRQRNTVILADHEDKLTVKASLKKIRSACESNDPQQLKSALIDWGNQQWPDQPPRSVGNIAQRVNGSLATELRKLNNVLYKPGDTQWNGKGVWQALQVYNNGQNKSPKLESAAIQPLYRLANINEEH